MAQPETTALFRLSLVLLASFAVWRFLSGIERGARLEAENRTLTEQLAEERAERSDLEGEIEQCRDKVSDALEVLAR